MNDFDKDNNIGRDNDLNINNDINDSADSGRNTDKKDFGTADNYSSGYKVGENGEYSYVYRPKNEEPKRKKKGKAKYVVISVCAVILCFALTVGAFAIGKYSAGLSGNDSESGSGDNLSDNMVNFESESGGGESTLHNPDININKSDSIKDDGSKQTSAGQAYNTVTQVWEAVSDSVVEITTEIVQNSSWMGQYVTTGAGSGVIIEKTGYIVTNNHVIEGANTVKVRLADGSEYEASLVGTDEQSDIAVIKIDPGEKELTVASLGCSADLVVGESVIAIGNPLGSLGGTVTTGIISATERNITVDGEEMVLLQTSAAINPGNSGGGLFNMAGQLIGVVNAKASGDDVEGLGFAIPIDSAYEIITELIHYGYVRGVVDCGLSLYDVTNSQVAMAYFGTRSVGVFVVESKYSDEFQYGDRIVAVGGVEVTSSDGVKAALKDYQVGDGVIFTVVRNGNYQEISLVLKEYVPENVNFTE